MQTTDYGIQITEIRAKFEMQKFEREWIRQTHEMCFCYGFDKALYLELNSWVVSEN